MKISWTGLEDFPFDEPTAQDSKALLPKNTSKTLLGYGKPLEPGSEGNSSIKSYRQAPEKISPVFDGSQLLVFGLFLNMEEKPTGVTITADSPDGPLTSRYVI